MVSLTKESQERPLRLRCWPLEEWNKSSNFRIKRRKSQINKMTRRFSTSIFLTRVATRPRRRFGRIRTETLSKWTVSTLETFLHLGKKRKRAPNMTLCLSSSASSRGRGSSSKANRHTLSRTSGARITLLPARGLRARISGSQRVTWNQFTQRLLMCR